MAYPPKTIRIEDLVRAVRSSSTGVESLGRMFIFTFRKSPKHA